MPFDSIEMTLIAVFLVCAVSMVVVCDFLRKTFFRPAAQQHGHGRGRHRRASFEGQRMHSSTGLSTLAMRTAVPVCAEVVAAGHELAPPEAPAVVDPQPAPCPQHAIDAYLWESVHDTSDAALCPRGMMNQADWQQAIASERAFTGVAVSISVNDLDGSMWHSPALMRSVSQDIAGLLGERGFGCRTAYDEFLIACPQEQDLPQRLKQITMRLWECQLRGQRAGSIRIAWGGVEARNQPLSETLAAAADRMRQSQRAGDLIAVASGAHAAATTAACRPRRRAV